MVGMTLASLVQHGEKQPLPGDPGLTGTGLEQATCTGRWLCDLGIRALFSSPMGRARETAEGNLLGDDGVPPLVLAAGIPPCAVTAVEDLSVIMIASVAHLYD
jgi:phosphohistidine phosphatase SixA